jgi:hypothetical protein
LPDHNTVLPGLYKKQKEPRLNKQFAVRASGLLSIQQKARKMTLIIIIILILLLGGGGGYYGYGRYGYGGGAGISLGTILLILLVAYLLGFFR